MIEEKDGEMIKIAHRVSGDKTEYKAQATQGEIRDSFCKEEEVGDFLFDQFAVFLSHESIF